MLNAFIGRGYHMYCINARICEILPSWSFYPLTSFEIVIVLFFTRMSIQTAATIISAISNLERTCEHILVQLLQISLPLAVICTAMPFVCESSVLGKN